MATSSVTLSPATLTGAVASSSSKTQKKVNKVVYIGLGGLNSYGGLKAQNNIVSRPQGLPVCTEQCFVKVVNSFKTTSHAKGRVGNAAFSKCSATDEIFKIAAIMSGLVLVGVAVGFVLLRIEAFVE